MRIVGIDKDGNQRCWWCGGQEFSKARSTRETVVLGVHLTMTKPTLRCGHCGRYSDDAQVARSA
jgi:DNA-directed RNA polymerase subunit RPC12/RpoP